MKLITALLCLPFYATLTLAQTDSFQPTLNNTSFEVANCEFPECMRLQEVIYYCQKNLPNLEIWNPFSTEYLIETTNEVLLEAPSGELLEFPI